tara:strand:+ start:344 stop:619 length:276 start_codon:yes stop_codon:yes gene_type:complete
MHNILEKLPSKKAERIYDLLVNLAEASPKYFSRERFIYHFAVTPRMSDKLKLNCLDGRPRYFIRSNGGYRMKGNGEHLVNELINKILNEYV